MLDKWIIEFDHVLRVVTGTTAAVRCSPAKKEPESVLTSKEREHSAGLMRVNHVGEVCAQALYHAQGRFTKNEMLQREFLKAQQEEEDHLAWTAERLRELNSHTSLLNPFWYAGAYVLGMVAAKVGDDISLGFVVETERQVEDHLAGHLEKLPENDVKSRKIVDKMRMDEIEHGQNAHYLGAKELPDMVKKGMRGMAKVMTTVAYKL
jgi:ubiquinone biosynthesis monooxygenase Coq7